MRNSILFIIGSLLFISLVLDFSSRFECWAKWGGSAMEYKTEKLICKVKHKDLGWIPDSNLRASD